MKVSPSILEVRSPFAAKTLGTLDPRCRVVQFSEPLSDSDYQKLAAFLQQYPGVSLRAYGSFEFRDLEFLSYFGEVRKVQIDAWKVESFDGLGYLSEQLEFLGLGNTKKTLSLAVLKRFQHLKELYLEGHRKDIAVVGTLLHLEQLTLRSVRMPDIRFLEPLQKLWWLALKLGGIRDLTALPRIGRLKYLELWMIRALEDLSPIADVGTLQYLFLQDLRRVTHLPDMAGLRSLRRVHLQNLKGLTDLRALLSAPSLEELLVLESPQLKVDDFRGLVGHPTLKRGFIALGKSAPFGRHTKASAEVEEMLGLERLASFSQFKPGPDVYDWR